LEISKRIKDEAAIADIYRNMGMVAANIGKSTTAIDNYFKSLSLNLKLNDKLSSAKDYNDIGEVMKEMEIYPKSMEYYQKAIKIWQASKNIQGISTGYQNIGEILLLEKKYDR
jgi:tetratricopeptide (TPR) repeat protein